MLFLLCVPVTNDDKNIMSIMPFQNKQYGTPYDTEANRFGARETVEKMAWCSDERDK